ncbi:hypothetical protein N7452_007396 [Penicillium brevicompactum]|uniref:Uncharacterized protein n=1 Tax=Penicillium brevicompactum TaxID=5074 RepID=A0A9W9UFQ0_PENBR|nr:hypothetical protein N7452_007396 [Penicillium brevicompactum]
MAKEGGIMSAKKSIVVLTEVLKTTFEERGVLKEASMGTADVSVMVTFEMFTRTARIEVG